MIRFLIAAILPLTAAGAADTLLNVSYDVTREFYTDFNRAFAAHRAEQKKGDVRIDMSHGGSSKQARAILDGLQADVATMNQDTDINVLARGGLVPENWKSLLPDNSVPYQSTIVFLVRKGNPKGIQDWADLAKPGVSVIIPNPKTSGNGRYSYLAAWAWAGKQFGGDESAVRDYISRLFKNVPVLESGGRSATNTFVQKGIGDVLLTFESETLQISRVFDPKNYDVVYPSMSIAAEAPVAVVAKNAERRGTAGLAREYLLYLWSPEGQRIAGRHFLRPKNPEIAAEFAENFPPITLAHIDEVFGGWDQAQKTHFDDGGLFDQIFEKR
ncbi:MAG: sulfate ABC transporter substrate-binding protein [Terrimicrobiaceae bacterium]|nr:sulfate ABC transporter substrate-binding protein [Terrimicrobiaceae bacterium]